MNSPSESGEAAIDYREFLKQKICADKHLINAPLELINYLNNPEKEVGFSSIKDDQLREIAEACRNVVNSTSKSAHIQTIPQLTRELSWKSSFWKKGRLWECRFF